MTTLRYENGELIFGGHSLERLAAEFDTPLYLYSSQAIVSRYEALAKAWSSVPHRILYSVKANSNLALLSLLARAGAGADVVSGGELARALRAGIPADRIVFAGAGKLDGELVAALEAGIDHLNVESAWELARLGRLAEERQTIARVALRITPQVVGGTHEFTETGTAATKFGIEPDEAFELGKSLERHRFLRLVGLHVHFGSQILSVEPFVDAARRIRAEVLRFRAAGLPIHSVNLGGGLGIAYDDDPPLAPGVVAAALAPVVGDLGVTLYFEPGRYLVGPAGLLLTRVIDLKRTEKKVFCVVDAGMNDLIRPALYDAHHTILPVRQAGAATALMDVVGPICESGDFLARDRRLPLPEPGDLLAVRDVGAYGFSMASNYNSRPRPAELLLEPNGVRLIGRRETVEDLWRLESL